MSIELTNSLKNLLTETALQLQGSARRRFMAQTVLELGHGGQSLASHELGWNRTTIRKGIQELKRVLSQKVLKDKISLWLSNFLDSNPKERINKLLFP